MIVLIQFIFSSSVFTRSPKFRVFKWLASQVENLVAAVELKEVSIRETPIILSNCALLLRRVGSVFIMELNGDIK